MEKIDAIAALEKAEQLVSGFGVADADALRAIRAIVSQFRSSHFLEDLYFDEKLRELENWSTVGFSTRRFESHGGVEHVKGFALAAVQTTKDLIEQRWPA